LAHLTIGQKAIRVVKLLMGLRHPKVASALAAHGFTPADLEEGWQRLSALTRQRLGVQVRVADPKMLKALDAFENLWFPITRLTLQRHFPNVEARLFLNLSQTEGAEVAVSVGTFLERLKEMNEGADPYGAEGSEAIKLLAQRGLTTERIQEAQNMLDQLRTFSDEPTAEPTLDEAQPAEAALWSWYLEWGGIARTAVTDRRLLKGLGFLQSRRSKDDNEALDHVIDENVSAAPSERSQA
jgi:hypothetical protein